MSIHQISGEGAFPEAVKQVGQKIQRQDITELLQIRTEYSAEELDELATSMIKKNPDGTQDLVILQPPWVASFTDPHLAQTYLNDASLYYKDKLEKPYELDDYTPDESGVYHFMIFGHRRNAAANIAIGRIGGNPETYPLPVVSCINITFLEANKYQGIENNHARPTRRDEALDIYRYREFHKNKFGETLTAKKIAEEKQVSPDKVANALNYARLPELIKEEESNGNISFTVAVTLGELQSLYRRRAERFIDSDFDSPDKQAESEVETAYYRMVHIETERLLEKRVFSNRQKITYIESLKGIVRQDLVHAGDLFLLEESRPRARRAYVLGDLSEMMLKIMGIVLPESENPTELHERVLEKLFEHMPDLISTSSIK